MKNDQTWTPPKLVQWIAGDMEKRSFPPPHRLEAELLVSHALNISRLDIYLQFDKPCRPDEQTRLRELYKRRLKREPLAYIIGHSEFWSLTFAVGQGVLIPRPDTEVLIEKALELIPDELTEPYKIVELGSGSGIIPIALAHEKENLSIFSFERSPAALKYANKNLETYSEEITLKKNAIRFIESDSFDHPDIPEHVDMIISNPPYIPKNDIEDLQAEVKDWEPTSALDGGKNGYDFYIYLKTQAERRLKENGYILFEHGFDQQEGISNIFSDSSVLGNEVRVKDYAGKNRMLQFQKLKTTS